jgi:hypothetical protein
MVQVVSILLVMIKLGDTVFQSREVRGAVWSGVLELERRAKGVSFVTGAEAPGRFIEFEYDEGASEGRDQSRR